MKYIIIVLFFSFQTNLFSQNYDVIDECMIANFIEINKEYSSNSLYMNCDNILLEIDLINEGKMELRDFWLNRRILFKKIYFYMEQNNLEKNQCILDYFHLLDLSDAKKAETNVLKMNDYMYENNPLYVILKKIIFGIEPDKLTSYVCAYEQGSVSKLIVYSELVERIFEFRMYRTTNEQFDDFKKKYDNSYEKLNCPDLYK